MVQSWKGISRQREDVIGWKLLRFRYRSKFHTGASSLNGTQVQVEEDVRARSRIPECLPDWQEAGWYHGNIQLRPYDGTELSLCV